ncbi:hypothetical protein BGW38_005110 [Lunasporangiospora selenospora]|uniref:DUF676 domain-containing protein n=1 Tax=Lunasporangiospora selenospora TaxID=979761 RepID=A0A9P6FNX6_9FUNG|nr:hypothetical protein BGW38_005110 [Lunasporangiospora selenospora]
MAVKPFLVLHHRTSLSIGGIVRYRIKILPLHLALVSSLQFRVRNCSPVYRKLTPSSGPWKVSASLVRNPNQALTPHVPELTPSIGCAQVCAFDADVIHVNVTKIEPFDEACNEWELEVVSEMVLQKNSIDIRVEVLAVPRDQQALETLQSMTLGIDEHSVDNKFSKVDDNKPTTNGAGDVENQPQVLLPALLSCEYKDTRDICGATFPENFGKTISNDAKDVKEGLHLVVLTHGVHGTWLDMLYVKEQIDAQNRQSDRGQTITLLTDTNHAGTEEGVQMAGRRVAMDILEFTGYSNPDLGIPVARPTSPEASRRDVSTNTTSSSCNFPRQISRISVIGHSLGGLINIYALGYIEDITKGEFFQRIQPIQFITLATPMLGVGFEHPWVLGVALSLGCIGQTGKDLAMEDRRSKLKRSESSSSSNSGQSESTTLTGTHLGIIDTQEKTPREEKGSGNDDRGSENSTMTGSMSKKTKCPECVLDRDPEPLLLAMSRPGSVSNRVLKMFKSRTSYANIENDMAVRFNTSTMMGIPTFDLDYFFSPEGPATQAKKNLYHSALTSTLALLFPPIPSQSKFLGVWDAPSPIVVVSHVEAIPKGACALNGTVESITFGPLEGKKSSKNIKRSKSSSSASNPSGTFEIMQDSRSASPMPPSTASESITTPEKTSSLPKSRLDLAHLVADGYQTEMDWTKVGVFIESEAHVQIIVRRKWYNLDGWKCIQDLVERHDFS